ncbi:MAG: hypothetical protein FWF01_01490 [Alphaproteobacteria bacterium]|nr:hypothetical protein [Alphaproteobacteria bacterium]
MKILVIAFAFVLSFGLTVAQAAPPTRLSEISDRLRKLRAEHMTISPQLDREYHELIMQLPPHMFEYIIPALFESGVPFSFLNDPKWQRYKGRKPTRIARQMQDFAKEHLADLSPSNYLLLAPEMWDIASDETLGAEATRRSGTSSVILVDQQFLSDISGSHESQQQDALDAAAENPRQAENPLTRQQVQAFLASVDDFKRVESRLKILALQHAYENGGIANYMTRPCEMTVKAYKADNLEKDLRLMAAKHGMTLEQWTDICDRTYKAYRMANMNLVHAQRIFVNAAFIKAMQGRANMGEIDRFQLEASKAYVAMFEGTYDEAMAVKPYKDQIGLIMRDHKFIFAPIN